MDSKRNLMIFAFIILVFLAVYFINTESTTSTTILYALLIAIVIGYLFTGNLREKFSNKTVAEGYPSLNTDEYSLSKYDNIAKSTIDLSTQEISGVDFQADPETGNPDSNKIDNSDVIESAITRGVSLFNPTGSGFSPLKAASVQTPDLFDKYNIPLSGQQNMDEMLARKSQHTGSLGKRSIDGAVRATRDLFNTNFQEELDENEKRVWWSSEAQDMETNWNPY